jgi:hypothetical protein
MKRIPRKLGLDKQTLRTLSTHVLERPQLGQVVGASAFHGGCGPSGSVFGSCTHQEN